MLTLKEAGLYLGVSYATVRRLIETGHLPAINSTPYGRKTYRIKKEHIEMFLQKNAVGERS